MDPPGDAVRRRTFYNPDPDYSRPLFQLQAERRERLLSQLKILYGDGRAAAYMPELERIIQVHCAHKPSDMIDKERRYNPTERFCDYCTGYGITGHTNINCREPGREPARSGGVQPGRCDHHPSHIPGRQPLS